MMTAYINYILVSGADHMEQLCYQCEMTTRRHPLQNCTAIDALF